MKEKVMFTLSLACFIGVMWLSSIATKNVMPVISEDLITPYQESSTIEYIDDVYPETNYMDDSTPESDLSAVETCLLKPIETDVLTFGNAFKYYRQCLGSDRSFHWQGSTYTTLLSEEIIIQVADSVKIKKETENNNEMSEIR